MSTFNTASPEATALLASAFAIAAKGGEIILLEGPIGAGKTWFTRAFALEIGVKKLPSSASFGMMRSYRGKKMNLYHFDLFRAGYDDLENLGVEEFFGRDDGVTIMEWSEAASRLANETGYLKLSFNLAGGDKRQIKAYCAGEKSEKFLIRAKKEWKKMSK